MKRLILSFLLVISSLASFAYDAYVDGIYYNLNSSKQTATVTYENSNYRCYTGSVVIPQTFTYNDGEYRVTSIGSSAFRSCSFLASVEIPNSVTSIGSSAFSTCSALTSITIPNSVITIGNDAFWGCSALSSVTIPNSVTSIGSNAFASCSALTSITIPNTVTSIGGSAFKGCSSLTSVTIPISVRSIGVNPFADCSSLTSLKVEEENPYYCSENDVIFNKAKSELISCAGAKQGEYTIPNSVSIMGERAFYGCSGLTSVTIPNTVTSISSSAFYGCSSLTSVTIPNTVTSIGSSAFYGCSSLTSVTIPNTVTSISSSAFYGCSSLTSVTIPNAVTSISSSVFEDCSSLTSVTIPNTVTSIGGSAFNGCSSLTSVTIPNSVTSIGQYAFLSCSNLKSVYIEDLEAWCKIDFYAGGNPFFSGSGKLYLNNVMVTDLVIPSSITKVYNYAFQNCSSITSVTIPNSVTSIGKMAFYACSNLASVTIGSSVSQIYDSAFGAISSSLKEFYCNAESVPQASTIAFTYSSTFSTSSAKYATLYVPSDLVEAYKSTVPWNEFGTITSIEIEMEATAEANQFKTDNTAILGKTTATVTSSDLTAINKALEDYDKLSEAAKSKLSTEKTLLENLKNKAEELTVTAEVNQFKTDNSTILGKTTTTVKSSDLDAINKALEDYDKLSEAAKNKLSSKKTLLDNLKNKAEELLKSEISCGENVTYILYDDGTLVISGSGDMTDYTDSSQVPWYKNRDMIKKVQIEEGVTSIGNNAFRECSNLSSVVIPNSVTRIGDFAFSSCSSITSFTVQKSVTNIGYGVFSGCSALTSLKVDEENVSYCSIDNVIFNKDMTELICCAVSEQGEYTIPNSVKNIGNRAFLNCSCLTSIEIPNSVTNIDYAAFAHCSNLTSVTIPNSVVSIGDYAFAYCSGLTSVSIGNSVTSIGNWAFRDCSGLTSITIPNSVTSIGGSAFWLCSGLTSVTIGNSVTSIGGGALGGCSGLNEIYSLNPTPPEGGARLGIDPYITIWVPGEAVIKYKESSWMEFYNILPIPIPVETIVITGEGVENSVLSIIEGKIAFLSAAFTPTDATDKNVTWASSNNAVATINSIGVVTAIAIGEATITATSSNGKTASCKVIVTEDFDKTANNFKTAYAEILGKSTTNVTSADLDAINAALTAYDNLTVAQKAKLTIEKNLLYSLKQKAEELNAGEDSDTLKSRVETLETENTALKTELEDLSKKAVYDLNGDKKVSIADVTILIDAIVNQ